MDLKLSGAGELVNRLSRFDKEVWTTLQREVRQASDLIATDARNAMPGDRVLSGGQSTGAERLSPGWGPWNRKEAAAGTNFGAVEFKVGTRDASYNGNRARSSIRSGSRKYRRAGSLVGIVGVVRMTDPGGIIYALMGKEATNSRFEREVVRKHPTERYPRALGPAWDRHQKNVGELIDQAIDRAKSAIGL